MNDSLDNICKAIDDNLLRNLELMQEKIVLNVQIENILKDGHIELAKAKYIRGKESISILQVPTDEDSVASLFKLDTKINEEGGRVVPYFDISLKKLDKDQQDIQDPIKWFGVLVPQALRSAQKRFQESLYLAIRVANIQAEIKTVVDQLQSLYFLKNASCTADSIKEK